MKLVSYADKWYKLWSVWAMVLLAVYPWLATNWDILGAYIPEKYRPLLGALLGLLGIVTRLVQQQSLQPPPPLEQPEPINQFDRGTQE